MLQPLEAPRPLEPSPDRNLIRQVLSGLAAFLLSVAASGCASDESQARAQQSQILPGMNKSDVRTAIGEPHHVLRDSLTQWREEWVYLYGIPKSSGTQEAFDAFRSLTLIVGFFGTIAAVIYSGGTVPDGRAGETTANGWNGSKAGARRFSVTFDSEGRVVKVSEVW